MTILLNDEPARLPNDLMSVAELLEWKDIPKQGTAVAVNNKLVKQDNWPVTQLNEMDQVTVISAAYGG